MYTLSNAELTVSILDPIADQQRLGSRYCTGGYIWQVSDARLGELLSGPLYPEEPNTFDGQGMPDMFHQALIPEQLPVGGEAGCIGVGRVRRTSPHEPFDVRFNPEVAEFVKWDVHVNSHSILMTTAQTFHAWAYGLARTVTLSGRNILSQTEIRNQGQVPLPVRWFAHPFFPIPADNVLCKFSIPVSMPENPGYAMNADGYIIRKPDHDWKRGWYQVLEYERSGVNLTILQKHPKVGEVVTRTDFMPGFLPIWGNANTFSFEPYFIRELSPGESASWSIEYRF